MKNLNLKGYNTMEDISNEMDLLESFNEFQSGYICDVISEMTDGNVDIYYSEIFKNAKLFKDYILEAIDNGLCDVDEIIKDCILDDSFFDDDFENTLDKFNELYGTDFNYNTHFYNIVQSGQYEYYNQLLYNNLDELIYNFVVNYITNNDLNLSEDDINNIVSSHDNNSQLEFIIDEINELHEENNNVEVEMEYTLTENEDLSIEIKYCEVTTGVFNTPDSFYYGVLEMKDYYMYFVDGCCYIVNYRLNTVYDISYYIQYSIDDIKFLESSEDEEIKLYPLTDKEDVKEIFEKIQDL